MDQTIALLTKQVPPPAPTTIAVPGSDAWLDVEAQLGLTLPDDYKRIIEAYGDYRWNDFLYLLNPFSSNKYLNLLTRLEIILDAERQTRSLFPEHYPLPLYPEQGGLLPFLITDNGDTGFWITHTAANHWPILLKDARAPEFEVHFISAATLLTRVSSGRMHSLVFPSFDEDEDAA